MEQEKTKQSEQEINLEKDFIYQYLTGQSVESLIYNFPYSQAHGYRVLDKWGVIKSAGRSQSPFGKAMYFLVKLVQTKLPLEQLYYHHMPSSIREAVSSSTLHRIAQHARRGLTRTKGTALVVTPESDPTQILVGQDVSIPNPTLGKFYGALSYPMTYSVAGEAPTTSVARVLQQELLTRLVIDRKFKTDLVNFEQDPFMHINVGDVDVAAYHIVLPGELFDSISSAKLSNFCLMPASELAHTNAIDSKIRAGVTEIANGYLEYLYDEQRLLTPWTCELNKELAKLGA